MPLTNVNSQGSFNEPLQVLITFTLLSIEMSGLEHSLFLLYCSWWRIYETTQCHW